MGKVKRLGHPLWAAGDLRPGEAQHPPAVDDQQRVPSTIVFERGRRAVVGVAVDLDDELDVAPDEVDFEAFDDGVGLWSWQVVVVAEGEEELLQVAAGQGRGGVEGQHRL
jgi:hypothetical protein